MRSFITPNFGSSKIKDNFNSQYLRHYLKNKIRGVGQIRPL